MKKRILAGLLSLVMVLSMIPTALAEGGDTSYEVSNPTELTNTLTQIANSGATEATIVLAADVKAERRTALTKAEKELVGGTSPEKAVVYGVPGCHITFKSDGDTFRKIIFSNSGYLVGDITFDNVNATFPSSGAIYANGFLFEITDNAGTVEFYENMDLYGGSDRRAVESTHLVVKKATYAPGQYNGGNIYGGGKGSGTGGSSMTIDGSPSYTFAPEAGDVKGDVVIELGAVVFSWVVGGGKDANVGGNVTITYDGDGSADCYDWIGVITGAGHSSKEGSGQVAGNVTINANSGHVKFIYGTGWSGYASPTDGFDAGKLRSVGGNVTITLGTANGSTMQLGQMGNVSVIACGTAPDTNGWKTTGAAVGGNIQITVNKSTLFQTMIGDGRELNVVGVGINSVCHGTVTMTNDGGREAENDSGETWNMYACYTSGKILNKKKEERAVSMYQNDGSLSYLRAVAHKDFSSVSSTTGKPAEIKGDVYTEVNGGEIIAVYGRSSYPNDVSIDGNYIVKVTDGVMNYIYGATAEREMTEGHTSSLTFDGYEDKDYLYYIGYLDNVTLTNSSTVRLTGSTTYNYQPFYSKTVKNLTVDAGSTLGLKKSGSLTGNLTVNGTLALTRTDNVEDETQPGTTVTITADGTATGAGLLRPVKSASFNTSLEDSTPVYLEEYVYAPAEGSTLTLGLSPAVTGLSVNRKATDTDGTDVWFIDKQELCTVSYELDGGTGADGEDYRTVSVPQGESVTIKAAPSKSGYTFKGWSDGTTVYQPGETLTVVGNVTLTAQWSENSSDDWSSLIPAIVIAASQNTTPLKLNTAEHMAYVNGYPDGTVKPNGNITRAEVAAILYRIMDAKCISAYSSTTSGFRDVDSGKWYNTYVATLNNAGVITDSSNGYFRPDDAITRAELAAMLGQFVQNRRAANYFSDVSAVHWAAIDIAVCANMGWINGYPDGTFRPDATITRAEMMAMVNRALERTPESKDDLLPGMKTWSDNASTNAWYYLDVQEATNSHTYTKSGTKETWTQLTSNTSF